MHVHELINYYYDVLAFFAFTEFIQYRDTLQYNIDIPILMNLVVAEVRI